MLQSAVDSARTAREGGPDPRVGAARIRGVTGSDAERPLRERRRRHGAWAALALLVLVFGAPCLARALEPARSVCCARGRCCCAPAKAEPGACWRTACGCGRHDAGEVRVAALDPAVPVGSPRLLFDEAVGSSLPSAERSALSRPSEIESPPPRPRSASA